VIIKFCLVFPKIFLLHKVVRDAKKVEKHCSILPQCIYPRLLSCICVFFSLLRYMLKV